MTGPITISGEISDANALPLPGVTVTLAGTSDSVQTDSNGMYSFSGLVAGSYSVRPTFGGCSFVPDVVNLNNLSTSTTQNFNGSGPSCGGASSVNSGATSGPFTISGKVTDTSGIAVVGAEITLGGNAQAVRFSDFTGGYDFNVSPGSYSLTSSGACSVAPSNVSINNVSASVTQNFVATTTGCVTMSLVNVVATGQFMRLSQGGAVLGRTGVTLQNLATPAAAVASLQAIATELPGVSLRSLTIDGLPAVERQASLNYGASLMPEMPGNHGAPSGGTMTSLTTAIAVGSTVARFNTNLPGNASANTISIFFRAGRDFTPNELPTLHGPLPPIIPAAAPVPPATPPHLALPLIPATTTSTVGEIAVAASDSTNSVVYASNGSANGLLVGQVMYSTNLGATTQVATLAPTPSVNLLTAVGDPSLAVGAPQSTTTPVQSFYFTELFGSVSPVTNDWLDLKVVSFQNLDGTGSNFKQLADKFPLDCSVASNDCYVADQPQLAADRKTRSGMGDQLYLAWRGFATMTAFSGIGLNCSPDGGNSWIHLDESTLMGLHDFPRISVGPDGFVYVLSEVAGTATGTYNLSVQKFSNCMSGFHPQFSTVIAENIGQTPATAPISGLDRQPSGQYMIAPDDTSAGNRLFVTYVADDGNGNDAIDVAESTDGGMTWTLGATPVNSNPVGARFFPWACVSQGIAYVTWYDRRDSPTQQPDLTAYYFGSMLDQTDAGIPTIRSDFSVSGPPQFDDPECLSGFLPDQYINGAGSVRNVLEETECKDLPLRQVNAGVCTEGGAPVGGITTPPGSFELCDFREANNCSVLGEACATGGGGPKYGDYNAAACAHGQLFAAWTSATPPQGVVCGQSGAACTASPNSCCNGVPCIMGACRPAALEMALDDGGTCVANNAPCREAASEVNNCCSLNCLGGVCEPGVTVYTSSNIVSTESQCATMTLPPSTPPLSFTGAFSVDTGLAPYSAIGATYGESQPACPNQLVVDVNLSPSLAGENFFVSGSWSNTLSVPSSNCTALSATTIVFGRPAVGPFQIWDEVSSQSELQGSLCNATTTHTNPADEGSGGTFVPAGMFAELRIAVEATQNGQKVDAQIIGSIVP